MFRIGDIYKSENYTYIILEVNKKFEISPILIKYYGFGDINDIEYDYVVMYSIAGIRYCQASFIEMQKYKYSGTFIFPVAPLIQAIKTNGNITKAVNDCKNYA